MVICQGDKQDAMKRQITFNKTSNMFSIETLSNSCVKTSKNLFKNHIIKIKFIKEIKRKKYIF